jgi:hypothetical protein
MTQPVGRMTTYVPRELPLDHEGFVRSFAVEDSEGIQAFFDEYGFVVVNGVLTEEERVATISDIWTLIEKFCGGKFNITRDDPSSWQKRWPGGGPGLMGQAKTAASWHNRANARLRTVFERIVGTDRLRSSVDNFGVLRPTRRIPMRPLPPQLPCRTDVVAPPAAAGEDAAAAADQDGQSVTVDQPAWKTTSKWLHWDLNPFHWVDKTMPPYEFSEYSFISENNGSELDGRVKVQGLLNLIDARKEDGGFLCVPGFHRHLAEWVALPENQSVRADLIEAFDFVTVPKDDPMQEHVRPVPMRAGALLVWNSELPHCNYSNDSDRFRMVQYVKCFPTPAAGAVSLDKRRACIAAMVPAAVVKELDDTQRAMIGLQDYSPLLQAPDLP